MTGHDTPSRRGPVLVEYGAAAPRPNPAASPDPVPPEPQAPPSGDGRDARAPRGPGVAPSPADAPPINDGLPPALPRPRTMELVTRIVGSGPSPVTRFFLNTLVALLTFVLSMAALRFFDNLMMRYPVLGWIGIVLFFAGSSDAAVRAAGLALVLFSLGSMVAASLVLLTSGAKYLRPALIQGTLPLIGFVLFLFA